jgi:hypothetical protein
MLSHNSWNAFHGINVVVSLTGWTALSYKNTLLDDVVIFMPFTLSTSRSGKHFMSVKDLEQFRN